MLFIVLTVTAFLIVFRPTLINMSLWRGDQYWMSGNHDGGLRSYRKALILGGGDVRVREALGEAYDFFERYDDSARQYEALVRLDPARAEYRYRLGVSLMGRKRFEPATRRLEEAIRLEPGLRAAYRPLGKSYVELGRPEKALAVYRTFKRKFPSAKSVDALIETVEKSRSQGD